MYGVLVTPFVFIYLFHIWYQNFGKNSRKTHSKAVYFNRPLHSENAAVNGRRPEIPFIKSVILKMFHAPYNKN